MAQFTTEPETERDGEGRGARDEGEELGKSERAATARKGWRRLASGWAGLASGDGDSGGRSCATRPFR